MIKISETRRKVNGNFDEIKIKLFLIKKSDNKIKTSFQTISLIKCLISPIYRF